MYARKREPVYHLPLHLKDRWIIDIDYGFNFIKCSTKHHLDKDADEAVMEEEEKWTLPKLNEDGQWMVREIDDRLTPDELVMAQLVIMESEKIRKPSKKSLSRSVIGNKYSKALPTKPSVWILLDTREPGLPSFLKHLPYVLHIALPSKMPTGDEQYGGPGGDVWIVVGDGSMIFPIERKHIYDMNASTHSKHKKTQISKIKASGIPAHCFTWLLEHDTLAASLCDKCIDKRLHDPTIEALCEARTSLSNLALRDGFSITQTYRGLLGTIAYILSVARSVQEHHETRLAPMPDQEDWITASTAHSPEKLKKVFAWFAKNARSVGVGAQGDEDGVVTEHHIRAARKQNGPKTKIRSGSDNDTKQFAAVLCGFSGITEAIALDIVTVYPTFRHLWDAWDTVEAKFKKTSDSKVVSNVSRKRKVHDDNDSDQDEKPKKGKMKKTGIDSEDDTPLKKTKKVKKSAKTIESDNDDETKDKGTDKESDNDDENDKTKIKAKTMKIENTPLPKKSRKRGAPDLLLEMVYMLTTVPQRITGIREKPKMISKGISALIWYTFRASESDKLEWSVHPKNPARKNEERKLSKILFPKGEEHQENTPKKITKPVPVKRKQRKDDDEDHRIAIADSDLFTLT